jgi:glycosyltransferase involved in cell wall biosynthesis
LTIPSVGATAVATSAAMPPQAASSPCKARVVLLQTQAEAAGAQEISRILGQGLEAKGYAVHHIFLFRRTAAFDRQPNTIYCASQRPASGPSVVRMFVAFVRQLKALRPDAVLCFQHYGNIVGAVAAKLAGIDVAIANRTTPKSLVPRWATWIDFLFGCTGLFKRVVVNSGVIEAEYHGYPRRYRSRIVRIDHGFATKTTDLSRAEARVSLGLPADVVMLGCVARLHPAKNQGAAIRLLPLERDWHLALAGQGADRARLVSLATSLGVADRVHLTGELSVDQIAVFLRSLDVFVFPTRAETFGLAVVEAAQAGVPVVANDIEVMREVLAVDGDPCALFVDVDDPSAFATAVRSLLADKDLSATLTSRGTKLSRRYSIKAMVDHYAALIESVVPPSAKGSRP